MDMTGPGTVVIFGGSSLDQ